MKHSVPHRPSTEMVVRNSCAVKIQLWLHLLQAKSVHWSA